MGGGGGAPTHISRSAAGCGHDAARSLDLWQAEVADHDLGVFVHAVIEQVLWLQTQGGEVWKLEKQQNSVFPKRWYLQVSVDDSHIVEIFDGI